MVKMKKVFRRPIMSDTAAQPRRPPVREKGSVGRRDERGWEVIRGGE
jgi:hypothetical protein